MYQTLRTLSACLAIFLGSALIGQLWLVALSATSLGNAAHGLVYLLLALGLVGNQRLSLALTALTCSPVLLGTPTIGGATVIVAGQYLLCGLCLYLFIIHPSHRLPEVA